jgi:hypothetical protein
MKNWTKQETFQILPPVPIIMASLQKHSFLFMDRIHIHKSKLSFTYLKICTSSNVVCTGHYIATGGHALSSVFPSNL